MIERKLLATIRGQIGKGRAIVVVGARQVGKTTLLKSLKRQLDAPSLFLNCDEPDIREQLAGASSTQLRQMIGGHPLVMIDEAQRVRNIGLTLKLIADNLPEVQLIVSGSSALELADQISEPLTGRKYEYKLFPLSFSELVGNHGLTAEKRLLEARLRYGSYPEIVTHPEDARARLVELSAGYLYKDIFNYQEVRRPELLQNLLRALSLQVGNQVSYHELGQTIGANVQTVRRYVDLLEKTMVVFRLGAFSRNLRNEIKKRSKIYFYDNGVRNAVIANFAPLNMRTDSGALWENYLVSERLKANHCSGRWCNCYFWRTASRQEIDYLEEADGVLNAWGIQVGAKIQGEAARRLRQSLLRPRVCDRQPRKLPGIPATLGRILRQGPQRAHRILLPSAGLRPKTRRAGISSPIPA